MRFHDAGVRVVSLVSSPGTGKTARLERTLAMLSRTHRVAALVGDLTTENDAARLARSGAPVRPGMKIVATSAKTGQGMEEFANLLTAVAVG